jgi:predicted dinucleotide-binding enzyme
MLIGILGAGEVALAFSRYALRAGHQVQLSNSRGPESLKDVVKELGTGASAGTMREAAQAPIVLLAIPWPKVDEVLKGLSDKWENRILIDATNHFLLPSMEIADLKGQVSSEIVAEVGSGCSRGKSFEQSAHEQIRGGTACGPESPHCVCIG